MRPNGLVTTVLAVNCECVCWPTDCYWTIDGNLDVLDLVRRERVSLQDRWAVSWNLNIENVQAVVDWEGDRSSFRHNSNWTYTPLLILGWIICAACYYSLTSSTILNRWIMQVEKGNLLISRLGVDDWVESFCFWPGLISIYVKREYSIEIRVFLARKTHLTEFFQQLRCAQPLVRVFGKHSSEEQVQEQVCSPRAIVTANKVVGLWREIAQAMRAESLAGWPPWFARGSTVRKHAYRHLTRREHNPMT